jgi:hypothetical protein
MLYIVTWFKVTFRTRLSASQLMKKVPSFQMKHDGLLLYALLHYPFKSSRSPIYQLIHCVITFDILLPPSCGSPKLALVIQFYDWNLVGFCSLLFSPMHDTGPTHHVCRYGYSLFVAMSENCATFITLFSAAFDVLHSASSKYLPRNFVRKYGGTAWPWIFGHFSSLNGLWVYQSSGCKISEEASGLQHRCKKWSHIMFHLLS